jgi:hypothetical protein
LADSFTDALTDALLGSFQVAAGEKPWALVGAVMCFVLFAGYMRYQAMVGAGDGEEDVVRMERQSSVTQQCIGRGDITLRGVMKKEILTMMNEQNAAGETSSLKGYNPKILKKLEVRY